MLLLFKFLKDYLADNPKVPYPIQVFFWFTGTAKSCLVIIIFSLIALATENPDEGLYINVYDIY